MNQDQNQNNQTIQNQPLPQSISVPADPVSVPNKEGFAVSGEQSGKTEAPISEYLNTSNPEYHPAEEVKDYVAPVNTPKDPQLAVKQSIQSLPQDSKTHNPYPGVTLLMPEEKARELNKKGSPKDSASWEAEEEVRQIDRVGFIDKLKHLRKAA